MRYVIMYIFLISLQFCSELKYITRNDETEQEWKKVEEKKAEHKKVKSPPNKN